MHTSGECECHTNLDVTNSQRINHKSGTLTSAKHSLRKQPCDYKIRFAFAFALEGGTTYTQKSYLGIVNVQATNKVLRYLNKKTYSESFGNYDTDLCSTMWARASRCVVLAVLLVPLEEEDQKLDGLTTFVHLKEIACMS